ncbi:MAG: hypothetical protein ACRDZ4_10060 [Egibacteraceae bacterium]
MSGVVFVDREVPLVVSCAACGWTPSPWSPKPGVVLRTVVDHWLAEHWAGHDETGGEDRR